MLTFQDIPYESQNFELTMDWYVLELIMWLRSRSNGDLTLQQ